MEREGFMRFLTEHLPESPELKIEYELQDSEREELRKISPDLVADKIYVSGGQVTNGLTYVILQPYPTENYPSARFHFWVEKFGIWIFPRTEGGEILWKKEEEMNREAFFLHDILQKLSTRI